MNTLGKFFAGGCLLVLLVFGGCTAYVMLAPKEDTGPPFSEKLDAYRACEDAVTARLPTPATAQFADPTTWLDSIHGAGAHAYRIDSHVDAQNLNGALVRMDWECSVVYTGSRYDIRSLTVTP